MEEIKLIYKEAEGKRAGYTALLDLLINCRKAIAEHLNNSKTNLTAGEENTRDDFLRGDYYDIYIRKRDEWMQDIQHIQNEYETVLSNIDNCIADTRNKIDLWSSRIRKGKG